MCYSTDYCVGCVRHVRPVNQMCSLAVIGMLGGVTRATEVGMAGEEWGRSHYLHHPPEHHVDAQCSVLHY